MSHSTTHRASPFHCPYCGEQDLFPREEQGWECHACLRAFSVTFLGQLDRPAGVSSPVSGQQS
ncbi:Insertion element protein [Nocardioides agariphilus]|jgi:transposase-like protein|uniref:Insertion element protein n=1 Tax=Nocardioides agariphilus TaxID=433664 RepID=A0A930VHZ7_9ACTN|nr:Insertion element protein [Nocardioides agariphilus]MBF4766982.1 Insertion element protein [Nocardioides agariphilus]